MISYLLPTRNRPQRLRATLEALGSLDAAAHDRVGAGGAEVIVIDNASDARVELPAALENGLPLRVIHLNVNQGAAARNIGAREAAGGMGDAGGWTVMLDDDSYPLDCGHIDAIADAPDDVAAIGAEIILPGGEREAGGLPEVFIGCGVAIRRKAFLSIGGYDPAFDYYAEEYDLCAKLLLDGWRITHDARFRVRHEKVAVNRDMNAILHRLVRNNAWVMQRYAPGPPTRSVEAEIHEIIARYAKIAVKERAACGFAQGVAELIRTVPHQPRRPMSPELFDRFTGLAHVRQTLAADPHIHRGARIAIVDEGKNAWAVRAALRELGAMIVEDERDADALVIGTLSPGPMMDAYERRLGMQADRPVLLPWVWNAALMAAADHSASASTGASCTLPSGVTSH